MRTSSAALACLLPLAGCSPSGRDLPHEPVGHDPRPGAAVGRARDERLWCARGDDPLAQRCTVERVLAANGAVLIVRWPDGGFRRLLLRRGGGVEAADGGEPALLKGIDAATAEVTVGGDRVRLPVTLDPPGEDAVR